MSLRGAFIFLKKILFNHAVKEVSSGDGKVANVSALQKLITIFHFSYEKNFAQTYGNKKEANCHKNFVSAHAHTYYFEYTPS